MTFFIKNFGCQYNEWDAARLSFCLKNLGLKDSVLENAEIVFIINCSVRKSAVDRALGFVRNLQRKGKKVIISGCILKDDQKRFITKGAILWNSQDLKELREILDVEADNETIAKLLRDGQKVTNLIPIMKGCNNYCSYCAVPYTRGKEESRPFSDIISDVQRVIKQGHKEIWLLGQNVNSYQYNFAKLLLAIDRIEGDFTVYFTSNHPKDMSDEIIDAIKKSDKIAKIIHLPLQSGSDNILKKMNRPYTKEGYLDLIKKLRSAIPDIKITTDIIVGFPGETEADFEETVAIFNSIHFHQAYINKYSPRQGTAAFKLGDPVSWSEKQKRWRILNDLIYPRIQSH